MTQYRHSNINYRKYHKKWRKDYHLDGYQNIKTVNFSNFEKCHFFAPRNLFEVPIGPPPKRKNLVREHLFQNQFKPPTQNQSETSIDADGTQSLKNEQNNKETGKNRAKQQRNRKEQSGNNKETGKNRAKQHRNRKEQSETTQKQERTERNNKETGKNRAETTKKQERTAQKRMTP